MKKAREAIVEQMEEIGEITTEAAMEIVRPHFSPDMQSLREQALRRLTTGLMAHCRDEKGKRACFNFKNDIGISAYVNIDTTKNLIILKKIETQLHNKWKGLNQSKKKVAKRQKYLIGQIKWGV